MSYVNPRLLTLKPYKVASHKIWSVPAGERSGILKLDWNEATVPPSPKVRQALKDLMEEEDFFHLYPSTFNEELMRSLSAYTGMPEANIQYFGSSDSLHEYIARAYLGEGKKVLVLWPSYDNFRLTAESTGAKLCYSEMSSDFELSLQQLREDLEREKPDMAYVCNPNNPTGTLIPSACVEELVNDFRDTVFLLDEAYIEFSGAASSCRLVLHHENLLVTRTLSKAFGLANIRFGYLIASEENIQAISRIRNPKNITTFTQVAAIAALKDTAYMRAYAEEVRSAREIFINGMNREPLKDFFEAFPSCGNFVLLRCRNAGTKQAILKWYEAHNIFVRNVSQSASLVNCIRVSVGTEDQMQQVLDVTRLAIEEKII